MLGVSWSRLGAGWAGAIEGGVPLWRAWGEHDGYVCHFLDGSCGGGVLVVSGESLAGWGCLTAVAVAVAVAVGFGFGFGIGLEERREGFFPGSSA